MFLLDTNVVSELRVARRTDPRVKNWAAANSARSMFLSAVTILELQHGVLRLERRDPAAGSTLRKWLDGQILPGFAGRILAFDVAVALRCAGLHVPDPRSERDAMIAATALVHGLTMVTRNVSDFTMPELNVVNPWDEAP